MAEPLRKLPEALMQPVKLLGKYTLYQKIAAGGMATVHLGRLLGPAGFARTVAVKRLHASYAKDPKFVEMFLDEARTAGRIRHPNVVAMLDVVLTEGELFLIMDYVHGEALSTILRALAAKRQSVSIPIAAALLVGALEGLHAAHELRDEQGRHLGVVHRDISPQNILVGADGVPRVVDFGVAKAADNAQTSTVGMVKGKLAYMAPEQAYGQEVTRRTDIYAMGLVAWELLTGKRFRPKGADLSTTLRGMQDAPPALSQILPDVPAALDAAVAGALHPDPDQRFPTALEFAKALSRAVRSPASWEIGHWVRSVVGESLRPRDQLVAEMERASCSFAATFVHDDWVDSGLPIDSLVRMKAPSDAPPTKPAGSLASLAPPADPRAMADEIPPPRVSDVVLRAPAPSSRPPTTAPRSALRIPAPAGVVSAFPSAPAPARSLSSPPVQTSPSAGTVRSPARPRPPVPPRVASSLPAALQPRAADPSVPPPSPPVSAFAPTLIAPAGPSLSATLRSQSDASIRLPKRAAVPLIEPPGPLHAFEQLRPPEDALASAHRNVQQSFRAPRRFPLVIAVTLATVVGIALFAQLLTMFLESSAPSRAANVAPAGRSADPTATRVLAPDSSIEVLPATTAASPPLDNDSSVLVPSEARGGAADKRHGGVRRLRFHAR